MYNSMTFIDGETPLNQDNLNNLVKGIDFLIDSTLARSFTVALDASGNIIWVSSNTTFSGGDFVKYASNAKDLILGEDVTSISGAFGSQATMKNIYVYNENIYNMVKANSTVTSDTNVEIVESYNFTKNILLSIANGTLTDSQISTALETYLAENPIEGVGEKGEDGDSAYQVAVNNGYEGSEEEWLESLKGVSVDNATVMDSGPYAGDLVISLSSGKTLYCGAVKGSNGTDGKDGTNGTDGVGIASITQTEMSEEDNGNNVIMATLTDGSASVFIIKNGSKGSTGDKGEQGETGPQGPQGEQGIQGEMADTTELKLQVNDLDTRLSVFEEISSKLQTVSSVEEMVDTNQQYILESTGTIWEYKESAVQAFTNKISSSTDTDGSVYNEVGYKDNTRLNSSYSAVDYTGTFLTGIIAVNEGDIVRFSGGVISGTDSQVQIVLVKTDGNYDVALNALGVSDGTDTNVETKFQPYVYENGELKSVTIPTGRYTAGFRVCGVGSGANAIITVNEEIAYNTVGSWVDTGITEDGGSYNLGTMALSIKENSDHIKTIDNRLSTAEKSIVNESGVPVIPDYWKEEVDSKEETIRELQNNAGAEAFQFVWFSDLHGAYGHNNNGDETKGKSETTFVGAVAQYALEKYNIPLVASSGDIMSQSSHTTEEAVWNEYEAIKTILSPIDTNKFICTKGNHDGAWGEAIDGEYYLKNIGNKKVYNAIFRKQATDRQRVFGGDGTYFYVDCPQNIRFIMLNSHTDGDGSNNSDGTATYNSFWNFTFGQVQLDWLANVALNVPENYSVIIMAHAHLEAIKDGELLCGIINAYNSKTTYSGSVTIDSNYWGDEVTEVTYKNISVDVDFTSAKGEILPYFHGHNHKDRDYTYNSVKCIAITTAGGDIRDTEPETRVSSTATETALDIVTVDKSARKIYCTRLGAGADRVITY